MSTDPTHLDIYDTASSCDKRLARIHRRPNALVQADGSQQLFLHMDMVANVIESQGLFDIIECESIHCFQKRQVGKPVVRIGINCQLGIWETLADRLNHCEIMTAPDLQLNALVTGIERGRDPVNRRWNIGNPKADTHIDSIANA